MPEKKRWVDRLEPSDVIAVITIIGGFTLMALHINTVVGGITTMVAAYYFGRRNTR